MSYGLSPDFERKVAYLSATSRNFWLRLGCHIKPDEIVDPEYAYLFKVLRVVSKDHGHPSADLVLQRLTYLYNEGKFKLEVFDKLIDIFTQPPVIEDAEKILQELIPPVKANLKQELANEVVNNYISDTGKKYGDLISRMEAVDKLGSPVVDAELKSAELGEDSFAIMEHVGTDIMMPLGVPELDHALHGGAPLGALTTFLADSGGGKSVMLAFVSAIAAMRGENVAFLSVELSKALQHQRILASIMAVPINDLMDRNVRKSAIEGLNNLKQMGKIGKVVIEHFAPNTISIHEAMRWFDQQEKLHGCRFRVRILDHGDLVLSGSRDTRESKYTHGELVWNPLAGMALSEDNPELQNWVFTATQSTRPQWKPGTPIPPLTRTQCGDSKHKYQASRLFITLTPQDDIRAEKGYLWNIDKNTYGFGVGEILGPIPHQRHMARMADPSHLTL